MRAKFGILKDEKEYEYKYSNNWWLQVYPNFTRGIVSSSEFYIDVMLEIAKNFPEPFWILYILVVSRCENEPGRYQSPKPVTYKELNDFCLTFKDYLQSDGRHHLWIASSVTNQMLVYDHHNVIYIYDQKDAIRTYFKGTSFIEKEVKFPAPHIHYYHEENDHFETEILDYWDWRYTPLKEGDDI